MRRTPTRDDRRPASARGPSVVIAAARFSRRETAAGVMPPPAPEIAARPASIPLSQSPAGPAPIAPPPWHRACPARELLNQRLRDWLASSAPPFLAHIRHGSNAPRLVQRRSGV